MLSAQERLAVARASLERISSLLDRDNDLISDSFTRLEASALTLALPIHRPRPSLIACYTRHPDDPVLQNEVAERLMAAAARLEAGVAP